MQSKKNTGVALAFALMAGAGALTAAPTHAATTIYALPDIGAWQYRTSGDLAATYTGNGFVENYGGQNAGINEFSHDFGVNYDYDKVNLQVDISGLAGKTVSGADLSFDFLETPEFGNGLGKSIDVTSFADPSGAIGYYFYNTPTTLGQTSFQAFNGSNSVSVTSLLQDAIDNHQTYFALQLSTAQDHTEYLHTNDYYSAGQDAQHPVDSFEPDRPNLRLTVNTTPSAVPEPSAYAAFAIGILSLGVLALRRRRATAL